MPLDKNHIISHHIISYHIMSCHVMSCACHAMSCHVMSCHVMSCHVMSRINTPACVTGVNGKGVGERESGRKNCLKTRARSGSWSSLKERGRDDLVALQPGYGPSKKRYLSLSEKISNFSLSYPSIVNFQDGDSLLPQ